MDSINAHAVPINLTPAPGQTSGYRLIPKDTVVVSFDELCQMAAEAGGQPMSKVKYVAECVNQQIIKLVANNARVHTGFCVCGLTVGGSLESMTQQPNKIDNPVRMTMTPEGPIVDLTAAIEVKNVTATVAAQINEFIQSGLDVPNMITLANTNIVVNGANIKVRSDKPDEIPCLVNIATGAVVCNATIVESDPARLVCKFATLPATAGTYRFELRTRNGDDNFDIVTVSRNVTVNPAA